MTDEEVIKVMKAHVRATGVWPRAEVFLSEIDSSSAELNAKIGSMIERGVVALGFDGRYRIAHPSGGRHA
jgi:hypothetical protein